MQGLVYIRKRVSVTVEEICECFVILFLSLESPQPDGAGELTLASGSVGQVTTLGEDLLSVGVGSGLIHHAGMMARIRGQWGKWWTLIQLAQPLSFDTNPYQQKYNTTNP